MPPSTIPPPLLAVIGPTASGKSALAMDVALAIGGEIINTDSMQVYRQLDIGTAKPSANEQARVPHHLLDRVDPDGTFSVGQYVEEVQALLPQIRARGKVPILCGGTGLYYRALTKGLADIPAPDMEIRAALTKTMAEQGARSMHRELEKVDAKAAVRIHPNDSQRILRALEVFQATGRPLSAFQAEETRPLISVRLCSLGIAWERAPLYQRIGERVQAMLDAGWVAEVETLRAKGFGADLKSMQALGYREIHQLLEGNLPPEQLVESIALHTRHYAKRQLTWFRRESEIQWASPENIATLITTARDFLADSHE